MIISPPVGNNAHSMAVQHLYQNGMTLARRDGNKMVSLVRSRPIQADGVTHLEALEVFAAWPRGGERILKLESIM